MNRAAIHYAVFSIHNTTFSEIAVWISKKCQWVITDTEIGQNSIEGYQGMGLVFRTDSSWTKIAHVGSMLSTCCSLYIKHHLPHLSNVEKPSILFGLLSSSIDWTHYSDCLRHFFPVFTCCTGNRKMMSVLWSITSQLMDKLIQNLLLTIESRYLCAARFFLRL